MSNEFLNPRTEHDIDGRIARILRDLRDPDLPLCISDVRQLLELDKRYYSTTDDGALNEWVHRLRVGSKQVVRRPALLLERVGLEQADGQRDLELGRNRGDAGDPYPGSSGNSRFDATSHPGALDRFGNATPVSIVNIALAGGAVGCQVSI